MKIQAPHSRTPDPSWKYLYLTGSTAAILAGVFFRRNLGVEAALFSPIKPPAAAREWFLLLQTHRLLGLTYLGIFDILNYLLVGLMLLALYAALQRTNRGLLAVAAFLGLLGIAVYCASNTALSMLSLSDQYAAEASEEQRTFLLAAGQTLLALNRFSSAGAHPGSGGYLSLLLIAASGLIFSSVLLKNREFGKPAAMVGILANALDILYCMAYLFLPATVAEQLAVVFIPAAGLFFMAWHLLVGWSLLGQGRRGEAPYVQNEEMRRGGAGVLRPPHPSAS